MRELTALVGRRVWLPLPKNPTPILGPTGLGFRPFGPKFSSPRYKKILATALHPAKFDTVISRQFRRVKGTDFRSTEPLTTLGFGGTVDL